MSKKDKTTKKPNSKKTYVFDSNGEFLRARPTKLEAVRATKEPSCFFFPKEDVKKGAHLKFFKKMKKYKGL